jgi:uncharacterized protein YbjQ (UPF0145 family)
MEEDRMKRASSGLHPVISMQPTLGGRAGEPVGIVMAEVVCPETEHPDLFAGLGTFVRGASPAEKAPTDIALKRLLSELGAKGGKLGADAILSTQIGLVRGVHKAGRRVIRITATGTAVVLPKGASDE